MKNLINVLMSLASDRNWRIKYELLDCIPSIAKIMGEK